MTMAVLVVDVLYLVKTHATHFNLPQALDFIRKYRPQRSLLVGMTHEVCADKDVVLH